MNNEQTDQQKKDIEIAGREVQAAQMNVEQVKKYFTLLEKWFEKYLLDHKKQEIPLAIIIAAFSEVCRGMDDDILERKKLAEQKILDVLDGKSTGERVPLEEDALYPDVEALTKGEEEESLHDFKERQSREGGAAE